MNQPSPNVARQMMAVMASRLCSRDASGIDIMQAAPTEVTARRAARTPQRGASSATSPPPVHRPRSSAR